VRYQQVDYTARDKKVSDPGPANRPSFKTPYIDGATQIIFEPMDFIAKLAALVLKPRAPCYPARPVACYAGLTRFGLVCIASLFHTS
jgi:hypothetical protein